MAWNRAWLCIVVVSCLVSIPAWADTPLAQRFTYSGSVDFFATGAPMAVDGNDGGGEVDQLVHPATVAVSTTAMPNSRVLVQAFLYWSGSVANTDCGVTTNIDNTVSFRPPGAAAATDVTATTCYCSDAGAASYDVQVCRADVTSVIQASTTALAGTYAVDDFAAKIGNAATDSASFSLVFVVQDQTLPPRRIAMYDGLLTMTSATNPSEQFDLTGLDIDNPGQGDLTWYTLEGDVGGTGTERVTVFGAPGGGSLVLSDAVNPDTNPMNHTINTVSPPNTTSTGVDIDRFDISAALTAGDTAVTMRYEAGTDKWWIVYNIVGVNVFEAALGAASTKTAVLQRDLDANGVVSVGDTVRYTITLRNTGTAPGVVDVRDTVPAQAASWMLVNNGGGTNASNATTLIVNNVPVPVGGTARVVFDVVIANVADNTMMNNTATFDARPDGDTGSVVAAPVRIRRDRDADTIFDSADNCPINANTNQANSDGDATGDACDSCPMDATNDADGDTICQNVDNCPAVMNTSQANADDDAVGDACDSCPMDATNDADGDGICQNLDNCTDVANTPQTNTDNDALGDACDDCPMDATNDEDGDTVCQNVDNCADVANTPQTDTDGDTLGDACDPCPMDVREDEDGDTVCQNVDNCAAVANPTQDNADGDELGDACDTCPMDAANDADGDTVCQNADNCPSAANPNQEDADSDGVGDACDEACPDADSDGVCDAVDVCPDIANPAQNDDDGDGIGDDCEGVPAGGCCQTDRRGSPAALAFGLGIALVVLRKRRRPSPRRAEPGE